MSSPIVGVRGWGVRGLIAAAGVAAIGQGAMAQSQTPAGAAKPATPAIEAPAATPHPRSTLAKMSRLITTEFNENKLEDVMKFLEDYTGAVIEVHWAEGGEEGLNREQMISMKVRNMRALTVLERVLAKATSDLVSSGNTWQMTEYGTMEVGPKSALNKQRRVELYDIHDMLLEIPSFYDVPQIDLQSLLQQAQQGGGGGGQSPFTDQQQNQQNNREDRRTLQEKGEEVIKLITQLVEPEEWVDGGGEGGTIRYYNGSILVNAPDYIHRQINGYTYWPAHTSKVVQGRRYVSLNMDSSIGTVDGFAEHEVTALVGGRPIGSGPGGNSAPIPQGPGGSGGPNGGASAPAAPGGTATPAPSGTKPAPKTPEKKAPKK